MVPGTRLVLLGKQGAGKGTQCVRLSRHYVVPHISTGDMFRGAVRSGTEAGLRAKAYMEAGDLIPDSVVISLVGERLSHTDTAGRGFVLDGFPRTVAQAEALAGLLAPRSLDLVINLEVETDVVLGRLASRRVCTDCGANYSSSQPPKTDWVCDVCGGEVVQREDDTEAAIRRRLELYERETAPLIAWYDAQGILAPINGMGPPDEVAARLVRVVEESRQQGLIESARHAAASGGRMDPVPAAAGRGDGTRSAAGRGDGPRAGAGGADGPRAGAGGVDGARAGAGTGDGAPATAGRGNGALAGAGGADGPRAGAGGVDGPRAGAGGGDGAPAAAGRGAVEAAGAGLGGVATSARGGSAAVLDAMGGAVARPPGADGPTGLAAFAGFRHG